MAEGRADQFKLPAFQRSYKDESTAEMEEELNFHEIDISQEATDGIRLMGEENANHLNIGTTSPIQGKD